jgi:hypothetical protein
MDGCSGGGYTSSEDMATWPSASEDELDIVGEVSVDESVDDDHVDLASPCIPHCPLVECTCLSRALWVNLDVILLNDSGIVVAEDIHPSTRLY